MKAVSYHTLQYCIGQGINYDIQITEVIESTNGEVSTTYTIQEQPWLIRFNEKNDPQIMAPGAQSFSNEIGSSLLNVETTGCFYFGCIMSLGGLTPFIVRAICS
ncbi:MAG: hypothetical protein FJ161_04105, partial [Gammaproteobacteria bacterium]|nr:hypothetical protein [Gammaproteobacteria bacterium]